MMDCPSCRNFLSAPAWSRQCGPAVLAQGLLFMPTTWDIKMTGRTARALHPAAIEFDIFRLEEVEKASGGAQTIHARCPQKDFRVPSPKLKPGPTGGLG